MTASHFIFGQKSNFDTKWQHRNCYCFNKNVNKLVFSRKQIHVPVIVIQYKVNVFVTYKIWMHIYS